MKLKEFLQWYEDNKDRLDPEMEMLDNEWEEMPLPKIKLVINNGSFYEPDNFGPLDRDATREEVLIFQY